MVEASVQVERLKATIREQEALIVKLSAEIAEIERELADFEPEYDRVVKPIQTRVEALRDAVNDLETLRLQKRRGADVSVEDLWTDLPKREMPVYDLPETDFEFNPRPRVREDIKSLYRKLARRFHPDLADDEDDRDRRNNLMAMINDAYAERDMDALQALDEANEGDDGTTPDINMPLEMLTLRKLQQQSAELAVQVQDLRYERDQLLHSPMMDLKLKVKLSKIKGRDLLQAMADDLQREYTELMQRLDELRSTLHDE